jgi:hypothetical protein
MSKGVDESNLNEAEKLFKAERYIEAFPFYEKLAYQGVALAQYSIAKIYELGILELDQEINKSEQAAYWYLKAAEQDHRDSQYNLAICFETGDGVKYSLSDAYYWFRRSSTHGDKESQEALFSISNTFFKLKKLVVNGYDYLTLSDAILDLVERWNSERIHDLIIYIHKIWSANKEDISHMRSELNTKKLLEIIELVSPNSYYEVLSDIREFEYLEKKCIEELYHLTELFTLYSIRSKGTQEPIYAENISIFKELKVAFDGYSEDKDQNSRSYVTYIHKNALDENFVFPEHEYTSLGDKLRPGAELHIYSWLDKDSGDIEVINIEDHLENDKMSAVHMHNILSNLNKKYNLISIAKAKNKSEFFYTLLLNLGYIEYERKENDPFLEDIKVIWEIVSKLIISSINSFSQMGRDISEVYVGFGPDYKILYKFKKFSEYKGSIDLDTLDQFVNLSKDELLGMWPDQLERISLTVKFTDGLGMPTNNDMLNFSRMAEVDCEAMIRAPYLGTFVMQGYDCGDYDTGYISSDYDDLYLVSNSISHMHFFLDLQDPLVVTSRVVGD